MATAQPNRRRAVDPMRGWMLFLAAAVALSIASSAAAQQPAHWQPDTGGNPVNAAFGSGNWYYETAATYDNAPGNNNLNLGAGGTATHNSGALSFNLLRVGNPFNPTNSQNRVFSGPGTLDISGGSLTASRFIRLGEGQAGTVHLSGTGALTVNATTADSTLIGWTANGTFNQSGGTFTKLGPNASANVIVSQTTGSGTINLSGGLFDVRRSMFISQQTLAQAGPTANINISGTGELRVGRTFILGDGDGANATMTITGGTFSHTALHDPNVRFDAIVGRRGTGKITQSGGVANYNSRATHAATEPATALLPGDPALDNALLIGGGGNANGTYELSGGTVNTVGHITVANTATGLFDQSGGTVNIGTASPHSLRLGLNAGGNGTYRISGGTLNVSLNLRTDFAGASRFEVIGDGGTINIGGNYTQGSANDVLMAKISSLGTLSQIDVAGNAVFNAGSVLEGNFDDYGSYGLGDSWNVLTASSITDSGIALLAPAAIDYRIVSGGNGQVLQLYVVPEPASLALLGIGGALLLSRRRSR